MLKKIGLTNFQSHGKSKLSLCRGVNLIVGQSDSGKSSVIRSLSAVAQNRPSGKGLIKKGEEHSEISIVTSENDTVERYRDSSSNQYTVNGNVLNAVGRNVPQEVTDSLRLEEINIEMQMNPPFLLSESNGEIARVLNRFANLSSIDIMIRNINSIKRENSGEISRTEREITEFNTRASELSSVPDIDKSLSDIEHTHRHLCDIQKKHERLSAILSKLKEYDRVLKDEKNIMESEAVLSGIRLKIEKLSKAREKRSRMWTVYTEIRRHHQFLRSTEIPLADCVKGVDNIRELMKPLDKVREKNSKLESCLNSINRIEEDNIYTMGKLKELETEFKQKMPEVCPLCGKEN